MKVAYLCPFEQTGYSVAATENIRALTAIGIDVVPRRVKMTQGDYIPTDIKELMKKDLNGIDAVIQHNLPSEFAYKAGIINVGAFAYEGSTVPPIWRSNLNLMDKIMVFAKFQKDYILQSCGEKAFEKTFVVPHALDTEKFNTPVEKMDFDLPNSTFKFYSIAEFGIRKNFPLLLAAYYSHFSIEDDVCLVIKSHLPNRNKSGEIKQMIEKIRQGTNRFRTPERYPKVILMTDFLKDEHIDSLHCTCDCFVNPSHAECFSIPTVEALGWGNYILCGDHTSFKDYIPTFPYGTRIESNKSHILGIENGIPGLYSSNEFWYNLSMLKLGQEMRSAYDNRKTINSSEHRQDRKNYVQREFNRKKIGQTILEGLNAK